MACSNAQITSAPARRRWVSADSGFTFTALEQERLGRGLQTRNTRQDLYENFSIDLTEKALSEGDRRRVISGAE
jgi:hypothetical protein